MSDPEVQDGWLFLLLCLPMEIFVVSKTDRSFKRVFELLEHKDIKEVCQHYGLLQSIVIIMQVTSAKYSFSRTQVSQMERRFSFFQQCIQCFTNKFNYIYENKMVTCHLR